jgi:hypothetical protein
MMRDDNLAFVQTRWTFTNCNSLLTWAQKVGLEFHFAVEQRARSFLGQFFNFNGTAGVWRIKAIHDAGGWESDTGARGGGAVGGGAPGLGPGCRDPGQLGPDTARAPPALQDPSPNPARPSLPPPTPPRPVVVEDMDLSLRVYLRGWRSLYLHDVCCPNELPSTLSAYKTQQFRWLSGPMQVGRAPAARQRLV